MRRITIRLLVFVISHLQRSIVFSFFSWGVAPGYPITRLWRLTDSHVLQAGHSTLRLRPEGSPAPKFAPPKKKNEKKLKKIFLL